MNKIGEYTLKYTAIDSSKNKSSVTRKIIVEEKPKEIVKSLPTVEKDAPPAVVEAAEGYINEMTFTSDGLYIKGCVSKEFNPINISLGETKYTITKNNNCYSGNVNLSNLLDGNYKLMINSETDADRKSTRLNSSNIQKSRMQSSD